MKTLAITLSILFAIITTSSFANGGGKDKNKVSKKVEQVKTSLDKEIQKHIFFPTNEKEAIEGDADVMLQVYPEGDVRVVLIQTKNPLLRKFIEYQVSKMKVDTNTLVVGQVFRYRFSFKKQ